MSLKLLLLWKACSLWVKGGRIYWHSSVFYHLCHSLWECAFLFCEKTCSLTCVQLPHQEQLWVLFSAASPDLPSTSTVAHKPSWRHQARLCWRLHLCHLCGSLWRTAELSPVGSLMDSTCLCHGIHFASATYSPLKPLSALLPSDLDSLWKSIKANLFYPFHFTVYIYLHWPSFGVIPKLMSTPHLARAVTHFHFTLVTVEGSAGVRQSKVWEPFSSLNAKEGTLH